MFGALENEIELKDYIISLDAGKSLAGEEECINKVGKWILSLKEWVQEKYL